MRECSGAHQALEGIVNNRHPPGQISLQKFQIDRAVIIAPFSRSFFEHFRGDIEARDPAETHPGQGSTADTGATADIPDMSVGIVNMAGELLDHT